jgi:myo-inositol 2-dehydrogenase / D-chiro-inositol 1-dehydrogenase
LEERFLKLVSKILNTKISFPKMSINVGVIGTGNIGQVGETGAARLPEPSSVLLRSEGNLSVEILTDWKKRFIASYDVELQEWIHSVASGKISGPSSWDGYAASVTADACVEAQKTGKIVEIKMGSRPALYQ